MFGRISLATKITLIVQLLVLVSISAVSYLMYNMSKKQIDAQYRTRLEAISRLKASEIQRALEQVKEDNENLVQEQQIRSQVLRLIQINSDPFAGEIDSIMTNLDQELVTYQQIEGYYNLLLTDAGGKVIYQTNKDARTAIGGDYKLINEEIRYAGDSTYYGNLDRNLNMRVVTALQEYGLPIAYLVSSYDVRKNIFPILKDSTGLGETGEVLLAYKPNRGGSSRAIQIINPVKNRENSVPLGVTILSGDPNQVAIQKSVEESKSGIIEDTDYSDQPVLAQYVQLQNPPWGIVTQITSEEINRPIKELVQRIVVISLIVLLICSIISVLFARLLVIPIKTLQQRLSLISRGQLPDLASISTKDEIGEMATAVNTVLGSLKRTVAFAERIGRGKYETAYKPLSQDDILGNSLLAMRDNIKSSDERDKARNWIVTGVAETSQILRLQENVESLGDALLDYVITRIEAVQGALYLSEGIEEGADPSLSMISAYAYKRKKYIQNSFKFGEGFVGQAAIERDLILRTEVPKDYFSITSGLLGEKRPSCLLTVPLITQDEVYGVLEFASFHKFTDLQIEFVKEISIIIARTIFNLRVNDRTVNLLRESQKMSEELTKQQYILKDNAETMKVTQEQLKESNIQLEEKILEVSRSQARLQSMLVNASEVIMILEQNGAIRYVSPSVGRILGYQTNDLEGHIMLDHIHEDHQGNFINFFKSLYKQATGDVKVLRLEYYKKDGEAIWLEITGRNAFEDAAISGLLLNIRDITVQLRAEQERRMRSQMQSLSENSPDLILRANTDKQIFYVNPTIEHLTGQAVSHFTNSNISELSLNPQVSEVWTSIIDQVTTTSQKQHTEMHFPIEGDREDLIMQVNGIPEFGEANQIESVLLVSHDITERKRAELKISQTNKKIKESINYAQRIQSSILPNQHILDTYFSESFMFYKPRDVVSGDFPWIYADGEEVYVAAVDCTGHGVPGALISLIGYFLLNDIVRSRKTKDPGKILDQLNEGVMATLRQDKGATNRDGMDIAFLKIDKANNKAYYSGAHRPLLMYIDQEIGQIKGNMFPVGGEHKNRTEFTTHELTVKPGDEFYLFSDGLPDQFGGPKNRKFSTKQIRQIVVEQTSRNMTDMHQQFDDRFESWKGGYPQTDDVILIGLKF